MSVGLTRRAQCVVITLSVQQEGDLAGKEVAAETHRGGVVTVPRFNDKKQRRPGFGGCRWWKLGPAAPGKGKGGEGQDEMVRGCLEAAATALLRDSDLAAVLQQSCLRQETKGKSGEAFHMVWPRERERGGEKRRRGFGRRLFG
jgi:hypothetical protein